MQNALLFTACLLGAAVLGGFVGSCCASKRKEDNGHEARIAELEDRLDSLADHAMEEEHKLRERVDELEFLVGDTPTGGLLGRVGALEDAERHRPSGPKLTELVSCVDAQADRIEEVRGELLDHLRDIVGTGEEVVLGGRSLEQLASRVAELEDAVGVGAGPADAPVAGAPAGKVGEAND